MLHIFSSLGRWPRVLGGLFLAGNLAGSLLYIFFAAPTGSPAPPSPANKAPTYYPPTRQPTTADFEYVLNSSLGAFLPVDTSAAGLAAVLADVQRRAYFLYRAHQASPHAVAAENPQQRLTATLGASEYTVAAPARAGTTPTWNLRLALRGIGRGGSSSFLPQIAAIGAPTENKVVYTHGAAFAVDYDNSPAGLRQNYTLNERPAGLTGPVEVQLALQTNLQVRAHADGQALSLRQKGQEVLRYAGLRAWDATGRVLPAHMQLRDGGHTLALVVNDAHATYPLVIDPLISTPTTLVEPGSKKRTRFGRSVARAGDVNGDGYADVLISAGDTLNYQSRVYVYHGSSQGLVTSNPTVLIAPDGVNYGEGMAGVGDVNKDGYTDVLIGAEEAARAYLYYGSSTGLKTNNPTVLNAPGGMASEWFGNSVAGAGDVDGDGYADVVVGAFGTNNYQGRAYLYRGSSAGLNTTARLIIKPQPRDNDWFGVSVAGADDVNKDGYADVLIGAQNVSDLEGRAYLYYGSKNGLDPRPTTLAEPGAARLNQFGVSASGVGDVDGDGYADIIVGTLGANRYQGQVSLFRGSSAGINTTPTMLADPAGRAGDFFGTYLAGAGDVDADGFADVLVGAYGAEGGKGRAYIYRGSATGLLTAKPVILKQESEPHGFLFGAAVAGVGDVNGDGYADILIGAEGTNGNQGSVYLYRGTSTVPLPVELASFTAKAASSLAVVLAWTTASEKNNAGFAVERSAGGQNFIAIGKVTGAGTSSATQRYSFRDEQLPAKAIMLYYRLRQTDTDGIISYSPVRAVQVPKPETTFEVYPTVASGGRVNYRYTGQAATGTLQVLNQSGQIVRSHNLHNTAEGELSLTGLPKGVYVVSYQADNARHHSRCVVE